MVVLLVFHDTDTDDVPGLNTLLFEGELIEIVAVAEAPIHDPGS